MTTPKKDGVYKSGYQGVFYYVLNARKGERTYPTKKDAAQAYIHSYLVRNPQMKDLLAGKTWADIFRIMQIEV